MKWIEAKRGRYCWTFYILVDNADFEYLNQFQWRVTKRKRSRKPTGAYTLIDGKRVMMHRLLMRTQPGHHVHHINHNALDNRKCNLKNTTKGEHWELHTNNHQPMQIIKYSPIPPPKPRTHFYF